MLRGSNQIPIQRQTKEEIDQAIKDLEERGFTVSFGPTQEFRNSRVRVSSGGRRVEQRGAGNEMWKAMMRREE